MEWKAIVQIIDGGHSLRARHVWFLKWGTFPSVRIFISLLPRFAEKNEKKEIGDVKTYGMFDKIHFGPILAQLKRLKRCFYNRSTTTRPDLLLQMKWNKALRNFGRSHCPPLTLSRPSRRSPTHPRHAINRKNFHNTPTIIMDWLTIRTGPHSRFI